MWQNLISPLASIVGSFVESRVEKQRGKTKVAVAKAEAEAEVYKQTSLQDGNWEKIMAEASKDSWKDEAWTILMILIIAMCFVPGLQNYVEKGFDVLAGTPNWFQAAIFASIAASFGLRGLTKFKGKK